MGDGITIDGVPLKSFLEKNILKNDKDTEIKEVLYEATKQHNKTLNRCTRAKFNSTQEKNSKVKIYTDDQIREEFGLMAKPYEINDLNVLWCVEHYGPINVNDIVAKIDGSKITTVSASISTLFKKAEKNGRGYLTREEGLNGYEYTMNGIDHQSLREILKEVKLNYRRKTGRKNKPPKQPPAKLGSVVDNTTNWNKLNKIVDSMEMKPDFNSESNIEKMEELNKEVEKNPNWGIDRDMEVEQVDPKTELQNMVIDIVEKMLLTKSEPNEKPTLDINVNVNINWGFR